MTVCKEVPKNTQGKDYDRSIAVILTYRGPDNVFVNLDARKYNSSSFTVPRRLCFGLFQNTPLQGLWQVVNPR